MILSHGLWQSEFAGDPELPHGDWAILAFERAHWVRVAAVYEATRDHRWVPEIDTEVLLVGFAAGFYPTMKIDVTAPTPCVRVRIRETGDRQPAWLSIRCQNYPPHERDANE